MGLNSWANTILVPSLRGVARPARRGVLLKLPSISKVERRGVLLKLPSISKVERRGVLLTLPSISKTRLATNRLIQSDWNAN